jgi:hypothetical protein
MSFGLRNAAQTFQRFMDDILRRLDFCFAYVTDILIFPGSLEDHEQHLRAIFGRLQTYRILINLRSASLQHPRTPSLLQGVF